jgi:glutathione S-transferase
MPTMAVLLARKRRTISRPSKPLWKVRQGEDSLCVDRYYPLGGRPLLISILDAIDRFHNETLRVYGVLEIRLSGKYTGEPREYLAGKGKGKYSVADIGTWAWVKGYEFSGFSEEEMKEFPHLMKWIKRIAERPAVQRGVGEKYQMKK